MSNPYRYPERGHVYRRCVMCGRPFRGMRLSKPMVAASCDQRPWELKFNDIFAQLCTDDDGVTGWHLIAL
jgi:hypothetical protein